MGEAHHSATRIVLVRHARPDIDPARPAGSWTLAAGADGPVRLLAIRLEALGVDGVVTSPEPKAEATARILSTALGIPLSVDDAFREQGLDTIPWIAEPEGFTAAVRDHFAQPQSVVFGDESSAMAATRFAAGVERSRALHRVPAIVTHGRVMCGYLRDAIGIDPMDVWPTLRMPDALIVDLESQTLARIDEEGA